MTDKTQLEQIVNLIDNISYVEDGVLDAAQQLRDLFVEQACVAVQKVSESASDEDCIYIDDVTVDYCEKAIRDKFK